MGTKGTVVLNPIDYTTPRQDNEQNHLGTGVRHVETGRLQPSHWSQGNVDANFCEPTKIKELFGHAGRIYFTSLYISFTLSHSSTVIRTESLCSCKVPGLYLVICNQNQSLQPTRGK